MKTLALVALFALASSSTFAQSIADPVPGHGEVTYFDLMKQVVPDLTLTETGATGHLPDGIEHIAKYIEAKMLKILGAFPLEGTLSLR